MNKDEYMKQYRQRPEIRERIRLYNRRYYERHKEKILAKHRIYMREYFKRPEVREKVRAYMREYMKRPYVREKIKQYLKRPEVKERLKKYREKYKKKKVEEIISSLSPEVREIYYKIINQGVKK